MRISTTVARAEFTNALIAIYKDRVPPTSFLRSFFKKVEKTTLSLSIAVQRGTEMIAVDVERGTDGNRNKFDRSTEKIFVPPYYSEYFNLNELEVYDRLFTDMDIESSVFSEFVTAVAEKMMMLVEKIERAYELQCAQVLTTGIVQLQSGINIDFKRKAESLVDLGNTFYWNQSNVDPVTSLIAAGDFLRTQGLSTGAYLDVIMGAGVLVPLLNNEAVQNRGKIFNYALDTITTPQAKSFGATFHGEISAGVYRCRLWSYNQYYDNPTTGVKTPYLDDKKIIVLPENPDFVLGFAAVPQLPTAGQGIKKGAYIYEDYIDGRKKNHIYEVQSAGVAIPVSIDKIWTGKVIS